MIVIRIWWEVKVAAADWALLTLVGYSWWETVMVAVLGALGPARSSSGLGNGAFMLLDACGAGGRWATRFCYPIAVTMNYTLVLELPMIRE